MKNLLSCFLGLIAALPAHAIHYGVEVPWYKSNQTPYVLIEVNVTDKESKQLRPRVSGTCSGALLSARVVLAAAHCTNRALFETGANVEIQIKQAAKKSVRALPRKVRQNPLYAITYAANAGIFWGDEGRSAHLYDLLLLFLEEDITLDSYAKLAANAPSSGSPVTAWGWGNYEAKRTIEDGHEKIAEVPSQPDTLRYGRNFLKINDDIYSTSHVFQDVVNPKPEPRTSRRRDMQIAPPDNLEALPAHPQTPHNMGLGKGDSGGPLLNERDEVIAVNVWGDGWTKTRDGIFTSVNLYAPIHLKENLEFLRTELRDHTDIFVP